MVTKILLSVLLMLGGHDAATVSIPKVSAKSIRCGKDLQSYDQGWHIVRMHTHHQNVTECHQQVTAEIQRDWKCHRKAFKCEMRRSLNPEHFKIDLAPTTRRMSLPTTVELHPPAVKPPHQLTTMPLYALGAKDPGDYKSPPNKPQRFGRSWEGIEKCAEYVREFQNPEAPQRQRINILCWSLLQMLARAKLWNRLALVGKCND
ncbi:LOW QUALITY PROTEIN: pro-FMRFamide-related neuropeptide VF [Phycodurus eques]|uniref:LOW QUALITY PROTEIN: pro-FMRFamide-related neuropeptide VF n=1 Tax=Phycodurus eques TaxID=693459 RepID=UPI002ACE9ED3|nr:LOW QUALITY PROTEIN: pro-FMRFamide-related neuropeptide VF [Phycodurus eques]